MELIDKIKGNYIPVDPEIKKKSSFSWFFQNNILFIIKNYKYLL